MNEAEKINFAVVGAGFIGCRHVEVIQKNPDAELVAVCDLKGNLELGIGNLPAGRQGWDDALPLFHSLEEMLKAELPIDVVCIATPNGLHAQHALAALNAGKHVLIEKPVALSAKDAQEIIDTAKRVDRKVFCVMQNRYSPPAAWLKQITAEGTLGKIFMVQINCYWNRDDRYYKKGGWKGTADLDGGTLYTQFSHFIDIMYWLFGDIKNITARFNDFTHANSTEFEDSGIVNFDFVNGGMGCINYSTAVWDTNLESSITVIAEKGTVKVGGQYMNAVEYCHVKDYSMPVLPEANPANNYGGYSGSAANHNLVYDHLIDLIVNGQIINTNVEEALKVTEIIENIYKLRGITN